MPPSHGELGQWTDDLARRRRARRRPGRRSTPPRPGRRARGVVPSEKPLSTAPASLSHHGAPRPPNAGTSVTPSLAASAAQLEDGVGVDAEQVGEPGQRATGRTDVGLEGVGDLVDLPRDGRADTRGGRGPRAQGHHRGAGAVGRLDHAGTPAGVREQRGVRVGHARRAPARRRAAAPGPGRPGTDRPTGPPRAGTRDGTPKSSSSVSSQSPVSMSSSWVREALPISVTRSPPKWESSQASMVPTHQSPLPVRARSRVVLVQEPGGLECREHRVERQTRAGQHLVGVAGLLELRGAVGGALVLPAERRADGATAAAVPEHDGLALHAERDADDPTGVLVGDASRDAALDAGPDLLRVLLHPAGLGVALTQRDGRLGDDAPRGSTSIDFVELVPWSIARIRCSGMGAPDQVTGSADDALDVEPEVVEQEGRAPRRGERVVDAQDPHPARAAPVSRRRRPLHRDRR